MNLRLQAGFDPPLSSRCPVRDTFGRRFVLYILPGGELPKEQSAFKLQLKLPILKSQPAHNSEISRLVRQIESERR